MKKKVSSSLLMAMLAVGSTGMFVSCSEDYDDDIKNLQSQIDGLVTADELTSRINELTSAIETARSEAVAQAAAAMEVAQAAQTAAANAQNTADGAAQVAAAAQQKAAELEASGASKEEVEAAREAAAAAQAYAEQVKADADKAMEELRQSLNSAVEAATAAVTEAQTTANEAKEAAEAAQAAADKAFADAKDLIDDASAEAAEAAAENAQKAAEALEAANAADVKAQEALANAQTAQAAAEAAAGDAQKAQETANAAQATANAAQEAATAAQNSANEAIKSIEELSARVDNAATKAQLDEVKSSLEKSISEVKASADAAAKAAKDAADAAQKTADEALNIANGAVASIATIQSTLQTQATTLSNLDTRLKTVEAWLAGDQITNALADINTLKSKVDSIEGVLKNIIGEVPTMVTSVSLYASDALSIDSDLRFHKLTQKGNTFPVSAETADKQYTFTEGYTTTDSVSVIVRVSPINAELKKENITLLNSQGEDISDLVECTKVEPYTALLTRAGSMNNGLWRVWFKMKDGMDAKKFMDATTEGGNQVLFAVAVQNTPELSDTRRVISSYDITLAADDGEVAENSFDLKTDISGGWRSVADVRNRYAAAPSAQEQTWIDDDKPGTKAILSGSNANAGNRGANGAWEDDRSTKELLQAEVGKPINIRFADDIKGFYVTLDFDAYAVDSAPSELNAWRSYTYKNVGVTTGDRKVKATLIDGKTSSITVEGLGNATGDVIGFRVYAVNLDGTLLDPDGRAFYVAVGNVAKTGTIAPQTIKVTSTTAGNSTGLIEVPENLFVNSSSIKLVAKSSSSLKVPGTTSLFDVKYYDSNRNEITNPAQFGNVKYVSYSFGDVADFVDDATYEQDLQLYTNIGGTEVLASTVTMSLTKEMPTEFLGNITIKSGQTAPNSDNTIRPFLRPEPTVSGDLNSGWIVKGTWASEGVADLHDVFNGLDNAQYGNDYQFVFGSVNGTQGETVDNASGYVLTADKAQINDATRSLVINYLYRGISTYHDATGWHTNQDYAVPQEGTYYARFATWIDDITGVKWANGTNTQLPWTSTKTTKPITLDKILVDNLRDGNTFGGNLAGLLDGGKGYLKYKTGSAKLMTDKDEENLYFTVTIAQNTTTKVWTATFVQNNVDPAQAPTSNVGMTLTFDVNDVYGNTYTVELPVTVTRP